MSDLGNTNWSETDVSNNASPPNGWPEGMNPSDANNSARAMMGAEKRFWNRLNATKTTAGSSTAYTLTYDVAADAYYDGELFTFVVNQTCGNAPTLNINGLGARALRKWVGSYAALAAGELTANQVITVRYNLANTSFDIITGQSSVPTGMVAPYAGATAPDGWLLCFGQAVSRTTYAALFAVLSTTYGAGDGSTTFNVPDMRGQVAAGKTDMGGSDAGNLSGGGVLGAALGSQTNTTTVSGAASVSGTLNGNATGVAGGQLWNASGTTPGSTMAGADIILGATVNGTLNGTSSGTSAAFSVVQPTRILNYIIRT